MSNCVIGVRVTPEDKSDFVRRAFRKELASLSYLSDADKKALGVQVTQAT